MNHGSRNGMLLSAFTGDCHQITISTMSMPGTTGGMILMMISPSQIQFTQVIPATILTRCGI